MSDNVAVMNHGRFEQIGVPQELYHNPASAFVAGFVGDANRWSGRILEAADGRARVETTAGLRMICTAGSGQKPQPGDSVEVFVRPEFIHTRSGTAPPEDRNSLEGTVDSLLFNGANSRVLVRTGSGELIEADVTLTGGAEDLKPGETVLLTWSADQALCFAAQAGPK